MPCAAYRGGLAPGAVQTRDPSPAADAVGAGRFWWPGDRAAAGPGSFQDRSDRAVARNSSAGARIGFRLAAGSATADGVRQLRNLQPMRPLKIAICGAGIGGLASAIALARGGHAVGLFERFVAPRAIGAGLMIQPTGLAALARLGLDAQAIAHGRRLSGIHGETVGGRTIFDLGYGEIGARCFAVGMHRGALFEILRAGAMSCGIALTAGAEIVASRLAGDARVAVDARGHEYGPFDLVIDATGIRSPLRRAEARVRLDRPYPFGAVWGVVAEPAGWPHGHALRQRYDGAHTMIGLLPIGTRPGDPAALTAVFWSLAVERYPAFRARGLERFQADIGALWPAAAPFVAQFKSLDDLTFATYADVVLDRPIARRLAFVGDAARAASPQLGQGANLALIDAVVLAECLAAAGSVADGLSAFAATRRAHTRFYGTASRWLTPFFQSDSRAAAHLRDALFAPMARVPYLRREMVRTLAGVKTGLFGHADPGRLHPAYALSQPAVLAGQPA